MSTIRVYLGEEYEVEDIDPEAPNQSDFYADPAYWEDFYRDDKHAPDYYEVWPGDDYQEDDNEAYGVYADRDGC